MIERVILYVDIFLLAFAIRINAHTIYLEYNSPRCGECGCFE